MGHAAICCCSLTSICPGWRLRFRRWFYRSNPLHGRLNVASNFISLMSYGSLLWRLINLDSAADFSSTLTLLSLGFAMTLRCFYSVQSDLSSANIKNVPFFVVLPAFIHLVPHVPRCCCFPHLFCLLFGVCVGRPSSSLPLLGLRCR